MKRANRPKPPRDAECLDALRGLMKCIDDGLLVRNRTHDALPLIVALKQAATVIEAAREEPLGK